MMSDMVIQFICRGNAFRSIIAEAYMNSLKIPGIVVLSSGTVANEHKEGNRDNFPKTIALLQKHGIAQYTKDHYADGLSQSSLDKSGIAVCLNRLVYKEASGSFKLPAKTYVWDVTDLGEKGRIATNEEEWASYSEDAYAEIVKNIDNLISALAPAEQTTT